MQTLKRAGAQTFWSLGVAVTALLGLATAHASSTQVSQTIDKLAPDLVLETVTTPHFRIHTPRSHRRFTSYLVTYLEEAYRNLSVDLHWQPKRRIEVLVRSDTDLPNGFAQVFPFNRLVIHAVPFQTHSFAGEYDNWIRTLAYHELTHVIANDTTSGLFDFLRNIFGSAAKVNPYQPLWLTEGLAVYFETRTGLYGRGRSHWVDMHFRTAALGGLLEKRRDAKDRLLEVTLDRLNDGVPSWPGENTPYIYGYLLNEVMAEKAGDDAPGLLSSRSGGRVPFFVNSTAEQTVGSDYSELWGTVIERLETQARNDADVLSTQPFSRTEKLTNTGRFSGGAVFQPGSPLIYHVSDSYRDGPGVSVFDFNDQKSRMLKRWRHGGGTRLSLDASGRTLFYSRYEEHEEFKLYSDIFALDTGTGREVRLTHGARALEPDASPDLEWDAKSGKINHGSFVYVKNLPDGNQGVVRWEGREETLLYRGLRFERISYPVWGKGSTSGWVFFSVKVNGGSERIQAIHVRDRLLRSITPYRAVEERWNETTPSVTSAGDLLYVASAGGVYNVREIAAHDLVRVLDGGEEFFPESKRITHLLTGAFFPRQADQPHQLYVLLYGKAGFDLALVDRGTYEGEPALSRSLLDKFHGDRRDEMSFLPDLLQVDYPTPEEEYTQGDPEPYSLFPSILPKYWLPDFRLVPEGYQLGVSTSGMDAVERHHYGLIVAKDSRANFPVLDAIYTYDRFFPTIELRATQENRYLSVFEESNRSNTYSARALVPVDRSWVGAGATLTELKLFGERERSAGFEFSFYRSDFRVDPDSIDDGGEAGYLVDLALANFVTTENRFSLIEATGELRIPSLFDTHFIRLIASYGASNNESISANYFLGGGEANIAQTQTYLLRGYQAGSLYGRKIATFNAEYWLPLFNVFRGKGTLPLFLERTKLRAFVDAGSAEFVALDRRRMSQWPVGAGIHLLTDLNALYRLPITVGIGYDRGFREELGGEKQFVLGLYARPF